MHTNNRLKVLKQLIEDKLGQSMPGWTYIVFLILGLFAIIFALYVMVKGGRATVSDIGQLK